MVRKDTARYGPKDILLPNFPLPIAIRNKPTAAPMIKAAINQNMDRGNPKRVPPNKTNFTSPKPIPLPRVMKFSVRSIKEAK